MEAKTKTYLKYGAYGIGAITVVIASYFGIKKLFKNNSDTTNSNGKEQYIADLRTALSSKGYTGIDGIVVKIKRSLTKVEIERLTTIINTVIYAKTHPDEYKEAEIVALGKEFTTLYSKIK